MTKQSSMIKRLKELRQAATPGPWDADAWIDRNGSKPMIGAGGIAIAVTNPSPSIGHMECVDNAWLIVETINNLDKLIAVCEAAEEAMPYVVESNMSGSHVTADRLNKALAALEEE